MGFELYCNVMCSDVAPDSPCHANFVEHVESKSKSSTQSAKTHGICAFGVEPMGNP